MNINIIKIDRKQLDMLAKYKWIISKNKNYKSNKHY